MSAACTRPEQVLRGSDDMTLAQCHDVALLDLDGVVYVGPDAVPGVPAALTAVRESGMRLAFVTNNAARTPETVAAHLSELGIAAVREDVITSAQAAAHYLADLLAPGAAVLVVGTTGLIQAIDERGLTPVERDDETVAAVVQGFSPKLTWAQLAEGMLAIRRGVPWVATNGDLTVPSPRGALPGNGSLVGALRIATGRDPDAVTGKPDPTMHRESVQRSGAQHPVVVGDRLDTDIEGANAAGCASLLVLTGVTRPAQLLATPAPLRPSYLGRDAAALLQVHPEPSVEDARARCGRWQARLLPDATLHLDAVGEGGASDELDALRALCQLAWSRAEAGRTGYRCAADDEQARAALAALHLI
jgi:HAD superfamily hydrolase (TIGR01450 family)